jgi:hypothetical protein
VKKGFGLTKPFFKKKKKYEKNMNFFNHVTTFSHVNTCNTSFLNKKQVFLSEKKKLASRLLSDYRVDNR